MAKIKIFAAVRPKAELIERIAELPYDVYSREEAWDLVQQEPLSFLSVDRGETKLKRGIDIYAREVYDKAKETYEGMKERGEFIQDAEEGFYLYELTMDGRTQTGLVALSSVDDYLEGRIKKHENTRKEKEDDRIKHVDILNAQTGPIFLAYRKVDALKEIFKEVKKGPVLFDFEKPGPIYHKGWKINDAKMVKEITALMAQVESTYIADGHHRAASAVKVAQMRREAAGKHTGEESYDYFLSVLFPDDELCIFDYNRILKTLGGLTEEEMLKALSEKFQIQKEDDMVRPLCKGEFGLRLPEQWYRLTAKEEIKKSEPVEALDVSLLQREVIGPLFQVEDPRIDKRIDFVGGIRGLKELEKRVALDCRAAFSMYPTSLAELFEVADAGELMPPKSTWFEPKLLSGLFIHEL